MKPKESQGNGSGKFDIHQQDLGGWVRVFPSDKQKLPDDLHVFLSHSLTEWFRLRPNLHIRCIVPICRDGDTVELHCWYDAHLFPQLGCPATGATEARVMAISSAVPYLKQ